MNELENVAGTRLEQYEGRTYARCVTTFPTLYFQMDGKWLEVSTSDYVIDVSKLSDGSICLVQIKKTSAPFNIFGMPLFIDYTTKFDDDASTVKFEPMVDSVKEAVEVDSRKPVLSLKMATEVEQFADAQYWANTISRISVILFLGISVAIWYLYYFPEWAYDDTYHEYYSSILYYNTFTVVCTLIFALILRGLMHELIMQALTPARIVVDVDQKEDAIANVRAGHLGLLGFIAYALHKLLCKKKTTTTRQN